MKLKGNKKLAISLIVMGFILSFFGGSLAYWNWQTSESQNTKVSVTVTKEFECAIDGGGTIESSNYSLIPTGCTDPNYAIKREIKLKTTLYNLNNNVLFDVWIDVKKLTSGLSNSENFKYALTTSSTSCTDGVISEGTFNGLTDNGKTENILSNSYGLTTEDTYYLYIWLDSEEVSNETMNQEFRLSLNGMCTNAPEPQPYIVYSHDDNSLRIYKRPEDELFDMNNTSDESYVFLPKYMDESYNINNMVLADGEYFDLDKKVYTRETKEELPWYEYRNEIKKVIFEDKISPISTAYWFYGMTNLEYIDISKLDTSKVTDMSHMFYDVSSLEELDLSGFKTSNVTCMDGMFYGMTNLTSLDISAFDTSKVTNMRYMFYNVSSLVSLDLSHFNTSKVTDMYAIFKKMSKLTSLNIINFDTSKVKNMAEMFQETALLSLDVTHFDTSSVTDMSKMFKNMNYIISLDLSSFDTSKVTAMLQMFGWSGKLSTIYVSDKWNAAMVNSSEDMFKSCIKLAGGLGTTYDSNYLDKTYARIDDLGVPGYFTLKTG